MKVYDLIQELCNYDADSEVKFLAEFKFDTVVEIDGEEVDVRNVEFGDNLELDSIDSQKNYRTNKSDVVIRLEF